MTGGNKIEKSLFELIQVAVGNQSALSSVPTQQGNCSVNPVIVV